MHIAQSKHPSVAEQHARLRAAEVAVRNAASRNGWKVPVALRDEFARRVEDLSEGRNTVLYTPEGVPGIYVRFPADGNALRNFAAELALGNSASPSLHDAFFSASGVARSEFFMGKYQGVLINHTTGARLDNNASNSIADARVLALPGLQPTWSVNFDLSLNSCLNNGTGFHLVSCQEWAYLYLLTLHNGYQPRGNTNNGRDHLRTEEVAAVASPGTDRRVLCGSGPLSWSHDGSPYGCWDVTGNVWEWQSGMRWNNGEVQFIEFPIGADHSSGSTQWRAIRCSDGALINPGDAGSLKADTTGAGGTGNIVYSDTIVNLNPNTGDSGSDAQTMWSDLTANVAIHGRIKRLGVFPLDAPNRPNRGRHWIRNNGERLPHRGGHWFHGSHAGVAALFGSSTRARRHGSLGLRPAFAN